MWLVLRAFWIRMDHIAGHYDFCQCEAGGRADAVAADDFVVRMFRGVAPKSVRRKI